MKSIPVWMIYYKVRTYPDASWRRYEWMGPCGVGITRRDMNDSFLYDCLSGRPSFYRTRALARRRANELEAEANKMWVRCKYTVRPFILSWTERN